MSFELDFQFKNRRDILASNALSQKNACSSRQDSSISWRTSFQADSFVPSTRYQRQGRCRRLRHWESVSIERVKKRDRRSRRNHGRMRLRVQFMQNNPRRNWPRLIAVFVFMIANISLTQFHADAAPDKSDSGTDTRIRTESASTPANPPNASPY